MCIQVNTNVRDKKLDLKIRLNSSSSTLNKQCFDGEMYCHSVTPLATDYEIKFILELLENQVY